MLYIRVYASTLSTGCSITTYASNDGSSVATISGPDEKGIKYVTFHTPGLGAVNGSIQLFDGIIDEEFFSYGDDSQTCHPKDYPNIGVTELVNGPSDFSLQRRIGSPSWDPPRVNTFGAANNVPTAAPSKAPTKAPTKLPTKMPTQAPTKSPTKMPTQSPTKMPTKSPTKMPTQSPTKMPTQSPTKMPTKSPTKMPTQAPTKTPTNAPVSIPGKVPTKAPAKKPTKAPTKKPATTIPTETPTSVPVKCGLLGLNIFCPLPGKCGWGKRLLNWGSCD